MEGKHTNGRRQFFHLSRAFYGESVLTGDGMHDEIVIGVYHYNEEGYSEGTTGEFSIRWTPLAGKSVPQLRAYDDGWSALAQFGDLIEAMSALDDRNATPQDIADLLISLGVEDATPTNSTTEPKPPQP